MNKVFDYNGTFVSASNPKKQLRTVKKMMVIDSADRDTTKYYTNGDFVVYLPRVYENVVSMRLVAAEFPQLNGSIGTAVTISSITQNGNGTLTVATGSNFTGTYMLISGSTNNLFDGVYKVTAGSTTSSLTLSSTNSSATQAGAGGQAFPVSVSTAGAATAYTHSFSNGLNLSSGTFTNDAVVANQFYFVIDIEGMNKADETTVAAVKSTYPDSFFAKIPALSTTYGNLAFIEYNDHSGQENIAKYYPAIGKVDRLHIRTRLHSQQDRSGFMYWTNTGTSGAPGTANFTMTLELEMLDNGFDDFSSMETRINNREVGNYGC